MPAIKTNDIHTYYKIHGTGTPLVFIHGAGVTHQMWHIQVPFFSKEYQVLTYDLRGHGQSGGSDQQYTCEIFADDLKILLDLLKIDDPTICGFSLGGMIAQEYAVKYPEALRKLILVDTAASSALTWGDKLEKLVFPKGAVKWLIRRLSPERYADFSLWFFKEMNPEVKDYIRREQLSFKREELLNVTDAIYAFELLDLSKIMVPTLIIVGEQERKSVFTHAKKMNELIRTSSLVKIPNAMHMSNLENPEQFNQIVFQFCGSEA